MVTIRLYTRRGCHLCEIAERKLRALREEHSFLIATHDIDADEELRELYGQLVPVIVLPGGEEMHYRVDDARVLAAITS
jgi:glutaredoxin